VKTGTARGSGTNSKVFLTVYGTNGKHSDELLLNNKSDNFENGVLDTFQFDLNSLGTLSKIRLRHDNSGLLSAWFVDFVELEHVATGALYRFDINQWLSRRDGDEEILREAPATGTLVKTPLKV
jgi:hypothetical protein